MKNSWKLLVMLLLLLGLSSQVQSAAAQTNLLQNAGFELPYNADGSANGWGRWFRNSSADQFADCANGYHKEPHWSAETVSASLIHSGSASQHVGNQWDTWAAGVLQTVSVTPGSTYRFTVWARGRASNESFPAPSEAGLRMDVQVGIDPNGSGLWNDADVKWSGFIQPHDTWQQASVEITATGDKVTVFTAADYGLQGVNQCRAHLDVWFDSAELIEVGPPPTNTPVPQPTSPPPPPATSTPIPTATLEPTATAVPTEAPTNTPEPPAGATICVNAFADDNGNGQFDSSEGYMGSVAFRVANNTQVVGQAISTGTDEAVCFEGLEAGAYQIEQVVLGPLEMTTAGTTSVTVESGQTAGVQFGSRLRQDGATQPTSDAEAVADAATAVSTTAAESGDETAVDAPEEGGLAAWSGLALLIVAVVLLGGILFAVLRRTA
ncbi:hypothetical protein [Candidatus Leptofilum sp.]|uniref:hypothetical protein n=1 Tax=Candidatus Leptofilum sp. TaxID=3241576 RepID=UPI003B5C9462